MKQKDVQVRHTLYIGSGVFSNDRIPNTGNKGRSAKNRTQKAIRMVTFVRVHYEYLCYIHSDIQLIVFLSKLSLSLAIR